MAWLKRNGKLEKIPKGLIGHNTEHFSWLQNIAPEIKTER